MILKINFEIDAPIDVVQKIIDQLAISQLLDITTSKIRLHNRFQSPIAQRAANTEDQSNDASFKQLQSRMSSELSQSTWIDGVIDIFKIYNYKNSEYIIQEIPEYDPTEPGLYTVKLLRVTNNINNSL